MRRQPPGQEEPDDEDHGADPQHPGIADDLGDAEAERSDDEAAETPVSVTRLLTLTRVEPSGSTRGTTALRATPNARESTSEPSASGYRYSELT